ncbi:MAG: hypothetical protein JNK40_15760 [Chromatiales bacterium]|nr:hypothetical protein [Chromatiales bacterium]
MPAWQRPNWTDPKAHQEALEGLPLSQWRWQWIRRHADYERDFNGLTGAALKPAGPCSELRLKKAGGLREKYGLEWLPDPAVDWVPPDVTGRPTVDVHVTLDLDRVQAQHDDGYAILAVDLTRTESDITESVKRLVLNEKAMQEIAEPPRQRNEWVTYARVLDADATGATAKAIADHISKDPIRAKVVTESDVRTWLKRGLELQRAAIATSRK